MTSYAVGQCGIGFINNRQNLKVFLFLMTQKAAFLLLLFPCVGGGKEWGAVKNRETSKYFGSKSEN